MRKSPEEVDALRRAGQAIDRVHARMAEFLRPGAPSARRAARSPPRSWTRATRRSTSSSSAPAPTAPSPHHEVGDRVLEARRPGRGRHRRHHAGGLLLGLHPDVHRSASRRRSSPTTSPCCTRPSWRPASTPARASPPSRSTPPRATSSTPPATATRSCTAPATASGSRPTRSPTSSTGNDRVLEAGHGVLDRARHLPGRPARRPHRGHRGRATDADGHRAAQHHRPRVRRPGSV